MRRRDGPWQMLFGSVIVASCTSDLFGDVQQDRALWHLGFHVGCVLLGVALFVEGYRARRRADVEE
jgi:hypothetical protein